MTKYNSKELFKYNQLVCEIRNCIFEGEFGSNGKLPPERKLAEEFGYSRVTVRTAIQQLKNEGLVEQVHGSGTYVKHLNGLHDDESRGKYRIGCVCVKLDYDLNVDPYFAQIFLGFHRASAELNVEIDKIELSETDDISDLIQDDNSRLRQYDGLVFVNYVLQKEEIIRMQDAGTAFVVLGGYYPDIYVPMVDMNNYQGMRDAMAYLANQGRNAPLFIFHYSRKTLVQQQRINAFRRGLIDMGCEPDERREVLLENRSEECASSEMKKIVKSGYFFDSVIVYGDFSTIGVLNAMDKNFRGWPAKVSVVGYDSFRWITSGIKHELCYIGQPFARMGQEAVKMIYGLIENVNGDIPMVVLKQQLSK